MKGLRCLDCGHYVSKGATLSTSRPRHKSGCPIDSKRASADRAMADRAAAADADKAETRRLHRQAVLRGDLLA